MTLIFPLQVCRDVEKSTWICRLIELITAQHPLLVLKLIIFRDYHCMDSSGLQDRVVKFIIIVL